jgi:thiol-disulfide isomerase/thioredoxin
MKKSVIIVLVVAAVVLAIGAILLFAPKKDQYTPQRSTEPTASTPQPTNTSSSTQPGKYIDYSEDVIANTAGTKILFFHAPWCPQCKALDASIKAGKIPDGVTIIKVDYDSSQKLKQKYGVTVQTTLVRVDDTGDLVKKYVAYSTPNLEALIKNVL